MLPNFKRVFCGFIIVTLFFALGIPRSGLADDGEDFSPKTDIMDIITDQYGELKMTENHTIIWMPYCIKT
jgi:hypothetical protein